MCLMSMLEMFQFQKCFSGNLFIGSVTYSVLLNGFQSCAIMMMTGFFSERNL